MKSYYLVVCGLIVEAANDDIAREIVYDACNITGMDVNIEYVQLYERESTND
jgi:hypothetical protein